MRQWPRGLDLCAQSKITQQPTDVNGDDNDEEGEEEEEEEEEEMGPSDEGAADATKRTTFNPVAGRIVRSTRIDDDDDDWSVRSRTRGSSRCCGRQVPSRTMLICRQMGRY